MIEWRDDFPSPPSIIQRQSTISSRKEEIVLTKKEEAQRRLNERKERLAEFQAKRERENAELKATKEKQAKVKSEYIEKIKQRKEDQRKETIRKISEKERKAEGVLKERDRLAIAGRNHAIHISDQLLNILDRSYNRRVMMETQKESQSEHESEHESPTTANRDESDEPEPSLSKPAIIQKIQANITLKSSLSKMIDAPLGFVLEQLKQLQTKVEDLETTINEKNHEIEELEETIISWKTKSICIVISLSLFLHGSGLYNSMKMRNSANNEARQFLRALPPYLISCLRSPSR